MMWPMIWERREWTWAVASTGAYQCIRPKLTSAQFRLRRPKGAATVFLNCSEHFGFRIWKPRAW